jgi:hypothetical protein
MSGQTFYNILLREDAAWQGMDPPVTRNPLLASLDRIIREENIPLDPVWEAEKVRMRVEADEAFARAIRK